MPSVSLKGFVYNETGKFNFLSGTAEAVFFLLLMEMFTTHGNVMLYSCTKGCKIWDTNSL